MALTPTHIGALVLNPEAKLANAKDLSLDTLIVTENGEEIGTIRDEIERRLNERFLDVANEIGLGEIAGDVEAYFESGLADFAGTRNGERFLGCLRWQPDTSKEPEFHPIVESS